MNWPSPMDFNQAVQTPALAFSDPDLKAGKVVVGPTGLPLPRSGNFADVYQVRGADGREWAVKCFTRAVTGLDTRYQKIGDALAKAKLPFAVGFTFLNDGVKVRGKWMPALKMEWVDGLLLNQMARDNAGNPAALDGLLAMWVKLCKRLREAGIAHGDIQHGNVLLVPGNSGGYSLKLIDYDGMYVPALANSPSGEGGHPNFQHPKRVETRAYSPDLDRFPHLVVATALKALAVLGQPLWDRFDTGDNMLFVENDFRDPANSKLFHELWAAKHPALNALVGRLLVACGKPIPQTPWLDQVAPDGVPLPLPPAQKPEAPQPAPAPVPQPRVQPPAPVRLGTQVLLPPARLGTQVLPPRRSSPLVPIAVVGGFLLVGGAVAGVLLLSDDKPTVQNTAPTDKTGHKDDDRDKQPPPPPPPDEGKGNVKPPVTPKVPKKEPDPIPPPPMTPVVEVLPPPRPKEAKPEPPKPVVRLPMPDDDKLTRAANKLQTDLKEDYARTLAAEKKALAQKLIGLAKEETDPIIRFAMLRDARDLAAAATEPALLVQALDGLGKWYEVDVEAQKLPAFRKILENTGKGELLKQLNELAVAAADAALDADDFDAAAKYAEVAVQAARKGALSPSALEDGTYRATLAARHGEAFAPVKPAADRLKLAPDDPDANLALGKFRCFTQSRWEDGLKLLAKGSNPSLKSLAELDLATPRMGAVEIKVADQWWEFAQAAMDAEKRAATARARFWYGRALAGLTGLERGRAETRSGFTLNGIDYRPGLFTTVECKDNPAVLKDAKLPRLDAAIDFTGSEFADKKKKVSSNDLSVKWQGEILPTRPGRYRLVVTMNANNVVKLRVDGKLLIDTTTAKGPRKEVTVTLDRAVPLVVEFAGKNNDTHLLKLMWVAPGSAEEEVIPAECLFHDKKHDAALPKGP